MELLTPRLRLVAQNLALARAELDEPGALPGLLDAEVPVDWPPPLNDHDSMTWSLRKLEENPDAIGWLLWYILRTIEGRAHAIGVAGFTGPPVDGRCEIGYSVMPDQQRMGYATEAVRALLQRAFASKGVDEVIAYTYPNLTPSIGVMTKCRFVFDGPGNAIGTVRYRVRRAASAAQPDFAPS